METTTKPKSKKTTSGNRQIHRGDSEDVETGRTSDSHSAVEQVHTNVNPLIEGVEGGQPRSDRRGIERSVETDIGNVEAGTV